MVETYILLALISIVLFAISSIISKFLIEKAGGPINFMAYQFSMGMGLLTLVMIYFIFTGFDFSIILNPYVILPLIAASVLAFGGFLFLLIGFNKGNVSVGGVILSSRVFISIPMAYVLMDERFPLMTYIFIFIALVGSIINSWRDGMDLRALITLRAEGMRWFMVTAVFWSLANFMVRYMNDVLPTFVFIFFRQIILVTLAWISYFVVTRRMDFPRLQVQPDLMKKVFVYALVVMLAQFGMIGALGKNLTITEGIGVLEGSATLVLSLIYARFINNEVLDEPLDRKSLIIRITGATMALLGTLGAIFW
ncbi:MAG: EamA family transporter [Candidatus Heimdallarchaeota archaeon]|nr:EamA family transporter [Candidatus Heimdallarchaeota archaeon]